MSAHISPVFKKNYRISLTYVVVKTVCPGESGVAEQLYQHGFHARHSTVSLLSEGMPDWALALEQRNSVHSLDLAKAFDSMPHYHLLLQLDLLGVRRELLD